MYIMKNNQSGRSMVEMLGVLAIIGVLSAGGLAGYSKAMFKHKLNTTMDQFTMLVTNIRTMYGTQENYNNLSVGQAYSLGIVAASASMGGGHSQMVNPFKGKVLLAPATVRTGVNNSGFTITYTGLPKEACIALATADWGTGAGSGFITSCADGGDATAALTGNTCVGETTTGEASEGQAYDVAGAITACDGNTNTVTVYFY